MSETTKETKIFTNVAEHKHDVTLSTLNAMANAVASSYGPTGANTLMIQNKIDDRGNEHTLAQPTKDGFYILTSLQFEHPACKAIKRLICSNMATVLQNAGDGTTTTTILISKLYENLYNLYKNSGLPAQSFINIGNKVLKTLHNKIDSFPIEVTYQDIKNLVKTASNGDDSICEVLYGALDDNTNYGEDLDKIAIHFRRNPNLGNLRYTKKSGFHIPDGAIVGHGRVFEKDVVPMNVIQINRKLSTAEDIAGLRELVRKVGRIQAIRNMFPDLLLITNDMDNKNFIAQEFIRTMTDIERETGVLPRVHLLEYRKVGTTLSHEEHNDLEYILGQYASYELGKTVKETFSEEYDGPGKEMTMVDFVVAEYEYNKLPLCSVGLNRTSTIIADFKNIPAGNKETLITSIKNEIELTETELKKNELKQRLKNIDGTYIDIEIGGINEWEISRKADAVEDCIGAIRVAQTNGICGGMSSFIPKVIYSMNANGECEKETKLFKEILNIIGEAYHSIFTEALLKCRIGEYYLDFYNNSIINNPNFDVRKTADMRKIIDIMVLHEDKNFTAEILESSLSNDVINTIASEKRILEAGLTAAMTLIGINQLVLPLTGYVKQYTDGIAL